MKTRLLKITLFLLFFCCLIGQRGYGQTDALEDFERVNILSGATPVTWSSNQVVGGFTTVASPLLGSRSLIFNRPTSGTITPVLSSKLAGTNFTMGANAYEWILLYKTPAAGISPAISNNISSTSNGWRFFVNANGTDPTLEGFIGSYLTQEGNNLNFYQYAYNNSTSSTLGPYATSPNTTYVIRITRNPIDGAYRFYVSPYTTTLYSTNQVGTAFYDQLIGSYQNSFFQASVTSENSGIFKWDNLAMYKVTFTVAGLNTQGTGTGGNNITPSPLQAGLSKQALFGFKLNVKGQVIFDKFNFSFPAGSNGAYFSSGKLYYSTDDVFSNDDVSIGTVVFNGDNANIGDISPGLDLTLANESRSYFLVGDINTFDNSSTPASVSFKFASGQNNPAIVTDPYQEYNTLNYPGATLTMPSNTAFIWTGNSGTLPNSLSDNANWSNYGIPNSSSNIIIAGNRTNYPVISANTTVNSLTFQGTNPKITINASSTLTLGTSDLTIGDASTPSLVGPGALIISSGNLVTGTGSTTSVTTPLTITTGGLTNSGTLNFSTTGVIVNGNIINASGATLNLGSGGTKDFNGTSFTNTGTVTMSGGTATIAATTFSNTSPGTFVATGGTVNFDLAGDQAINNTTVATGAVTFNNLTASISGIKTLGGSGSAFKVRSTGLVAVTTTGTTALAAATAKLTLSSDASGSTTVDKLLTGTSITGTVNVERYLTGNSANSRGYRLMSSPVSVSSANLVLPNLTYIFNGAYTTGTGGTTNGFFAPGNPTLYFYRENIAVNNSSFISGNFRGVSKINNGNLYDFSNDGESGTRTLPAGNGYLFFFRGDKATTVNATVASTIAKPGTFTVTGYLNQGSIAVRHWYAASTTLQYNNTTGNDNVRGYNLVGNPYASSINWDGSGITTTNLQTTIWVYNPALKVYATYIKGQSGNGTNFNGTSGSANIIPSGQGFFVRAISATPNPTIIFTEQAKVTNQVLSGNLLMSTGAVDVVEPLKLLRVQIYKDSLNREDALIFLKNDSKDVFVVDEDAEYLRGNNVVTMSTISADKKNLAINSIPLPKKTAIILPLNANISTTGLYQISLTEAKNIPALYEVYLMDALKKDSLDVLTHSTYNFNAVAGDSITFGTKRFKLVIRQKADMALRLLDFSAAKVTSGAQLSWIAENESNYTNFTVERSTDGGKTFEVIGGLLSSQLGKYNLLDKSPAIGQNQYRLKQDDINGTISYSKVVNLMYSNTSAGIMANNLSIYPNPVSSAVSVAVTPQANATSYKITVTNGIGLVVKSATSAQPTWQDNVGNLLPGTYFVQVINNTTKAIVGSGKFIKN